MKRVFIGIVSGILIVIIAATIFLPSYLHKKIAVKLDSLNIQYSNIDISIWNRSLAIQNPVTNNPGDSSHNGYSANFKSIKVQGLNLYEMIFNRSYVINNIEIDSGSFLYNQIEQRKDSTSKSNQKPLNITLKNIIINDVSFQLNKDSTLDLLTTLSTKLGDVSAHIEKGNVSYSIGALDLSLEELNINRHSGTHGVRVRTFSYQSAQKKATIDSLQIIPNYAKLEIGRHFKEQKSRIELAIPSINIEGLSLKKMIDSTLSATRIDIQSFEVSAFKDKRLPFRSKKVPMPMESFLNLPIPINIDSIIIKDSKITVEEIPENGSQSMIVKFTKVNGKLVGLNNRISTNDSTKAILYAKGLLMGTGNIDAVFTFPLDGNAQYTAVGSIKNLPFSALNQPLVNAAKLEVKSGYLNKLAFNFKYNDNVSVGKIVIDYKDLKVAGLTKEKEVSELKTFLINIFVKNDKSKDVPKTERTGIINIERDKRKFIFNFWWKSILDGLKSSILGDAADKLDRSKKAKPTR